MHRAGVDPFHHEQAAVSTEDQRSPHTHDHCSIHLLSDQQSEHAAIYPNAN